MERTSHLEVCGFGIRDGGFLGKSRFRQHVRENGGVFCFLFFVFLFFIIFFVFFFSVSFVLLFPSFLDILSFFLFLGFSFLKALQRDAAHNFK